MHPKRSYYIQPYSCTSTVYSGYSVLKKITNKQYSSELNLFGKKSQTQKKFLRDDGTSRGVLHSFMQRHGSYLASQPIARICIARRCATRGLYVS